MYVIILKVSWKAGLSAKPAWTSQQSLVPEEIFPKFLSARENTHYSHHTLSSWFWGHFLSFFFSALCLHQKEWKFMLLRKSQQMFLLFSSPSEELLLWMGCQHMYLIRIKYLASKSTKGRLWCASPLLSSSSYKQSHCLSPDNQQVPLPVTSVTT